MILDLRLSILLFPTAANCEQTDTKSSVIQQASDHVLYNAQSSGHTGPTHSPIYSLDIIGEIA